MNEPTRERIEHWREWEAPADGVERQIADMALRALDAEQDLEKRKLWALEAQEETEQAGARIREMEAGLRRMLHDPECDYQAIAWDLLAATPPPDSEPAEGEGLKCCGKMEGEPCFGCPRPRRRDALAIVDEVERYGHASAHTRKDLQRFRENCGALRRAHAEAIPAEVMEILREAKNDASKLMWHYNAQGDLPQEMTYANKISRIDRALAQSEQGRVPLWIVFDGPPGPKAGRFVEVENECGESVRHGEWNQHGDLWYLGPFFGGHHE